MEAKLLIVDDEVGIRLSLKEYFEREGFTVVTAVDGTQALVAIYEKTPDVIILDIQLPYVDGLEICKKIRQRVGQSSGIIMISGVKKEMVDRVVGLELGADVYMTKPFETRELLAQVRAILRRMQAQLNQKGTDWNIVDDYLRIHFKRRIVKLGDGEVHLTPLEFDLLRYLAERPGVPVSRSDLIDAVWGYQVGGDVTDSAVNTAIAKLRSKLEPDPTKPSYIQSVHGIGYRFIEY